MANFLKDLRFYAYWLASDAPGAQRVPVDITPYVLSGTMSDGTERYNRAGGISSKDSQLQLILNNNSLIWDKLKPGSIDGVQVNKPPRYSHHCAAFRDRAYRRVVPTQEH